MTPKTAALLAATIAVLAGCDRPPAKKMVTVTGTATYKGQQLKDGVLQFLAPNGDFATAAVRPDGKFVMTEVVPGEQKVGYILGPAGSGSSDGSTDDSAKSKVVAVPAKFGDPQKSGVTVTIPETGGEVTVELK